MVTVSSLETLIKIEHPLFKVYFSLLFIENKIIFEVGFEKNSEKLK